MLIFMEHFRMSFYRLFIDKLRSRGTRALNVRLYIFFFVCGGAGGKGGKERKDIEKAEKDISFEILKPDICFIIIILIARNY